MPLSNVERQVLEVICEEHRQTRRGAKEKIVLIGMNAANHQQKARIVDVLHALKKRGLLVAGADSWVPTSEGTAALTDVDDTNVVDMAAEVKQVEAQEFMGAVERIGAPLPDELLNRCAAMNATLLAQAKQAHEAGDAEAWRDLYWLMQTAQQLVALGGGE